MKQPHEWDAGTYHRVSAPQQSWGVRAWLEPEATLGGIVR